MSFTNHTPNYNLPQYVGTDKPTFLGDFNNAMTAIDTALHNNAQNAGEGLSELQQAQAALSETQETLTEVQTEVANVSGIASTVNQNVQQALTAANDATTAANSATSQIQPAVTAANQASADAQAAQQVANGNVTTLNELSERVTTLENSLVQSLTMRVRVGGNTGTNNFYWGMDIPKELKGITISNLSTDSTGGGQIPQFIFTKTEGGTENVQISNGEIDSKYFTDATYSSFTTTTGATSGYGYAVFTATLNFGNAEG